MSSVEKKFTSIACFMFAGGIASYYMAGTPFRGMETGLLNGTITCLLNETFNKDSNYQKRIALTIGALSLTYFCHTFVLPKMIRQLTPLSKKNLIPTLFFSTYIGSLPFFSFSPSPDKNDSPTSTINSLPVLSSSPTQEENEEEQEKPMHLHKDPNRPDNQRPIESRMTKNLYKAIHEHRKKTQENDCPYATLEQIQSEPYPFPLNFSYEGRASQGSRPSMEDRHFYQERDNAILTGIFDGHGGEEAAIYANLLTPEIFFKIFEEQEENIIKTFEVLFQTLHKNYTGSNEVGSTALICYIDKKNNIVYTATLGDTEANIYRNISGEIKSIPLSPVRDWSTDDKFVDRKRVFINQNFPKPRLYWTINVSRSIGDKTYQAISQKPKVTTITLQPEDILILCSDGLKDFVYEENICKIIEKRQTPSEKGIAESLICASLAVQDDGTGDNVSVIVIQAKG